MKTKAERYMGKKVKKKKRKEKKKDILRCIVLPREFVGKNLERKKKTLGEATSGQDSYNSLHRSLSVRVPMASLKISFHVTGRASGA